MLDNLIQYVQHFTEDHYGNTLTNVNIANVVINSGYPVFNEYYWERKDRERIYTDEAGPALTAYFLDKYNKKQEDMYAVWTAAILKSIHKSNLEDWRGEVFKKIMLLESEINKKYERELQWHHASDGVPYVVDLNIFKPPVSEHLEYTLAEIIVNVATQVLRVWQPVHRLYE